MKRWLLITLSSVFLMLLVLTIHAWIRSYLPRHLTIQADDGRLFLVFWEGGNPSQPFFDPGERQGPKPASIWADLRRSPANVERTFAGFGTIGGKRGRHELRLLAIPFWFLALVTVGASALCLVAAWRQFHRPKPGQCACCGYDLRASKERCPECGMAIPEEREVNLERAGA